MASGLGPVYFTDENTLGLGKLLRRSGREDVVYPGHEDLPEVPLGTLDLDWMPVVAQRDLIVLTRDPRPAHPHSPGRVTGLLGTRNPLGLAGRETGPRAS